jgi:hypothetical protein
MKLSLIAIGMLLCACGSDPEPEHKEVVPVVQTKIPTPRNPEPIQVKECVVIKTTIIRDCKLYDLMCDDGESDMVLLCPITYWDPGEYIPTPP